MPREWAPHRHVGKQLGRPPLLPGVLAILTLGQRGENPEGDPAASPYPTQDEGIQQGCRQRLVTGVPPLKMSNSHNHRQGFPLGRDVIQHQAQQDSPSSPQPLPFTEKNRLNPKLCIFNYFKFMPQNTGAGGCLFASFKIFIFQQYHVFLKTSFISSARACVHVCVLPELWFTFPDGWMGIRSPFLRWCIKCIYYSLSSASCKESFVFIQRNEYYAKPEE